MNFFVCSRWWRTLRELITGWICLSPFDSPLYPPGHLCLLPPSSLLCVSPWTSLRDPDCGAHIEKWLLASLLSPLLIPTFLLLREGNGTPLQYSCLKNPMDRGTWWAAVHGAAKGQTRLSDFIFTFHFHASEKEMATHSSVLALRIPGMGEPGGLPSVGSHRVRHDWSDLAAAASHPGHLYLPPPSSLLHATLWTSLGVAHYGETFHL